MQSERCIITSVHLYVVHLFVHRCGSYLNALQWFYMMTAVASQIISVSIVCSTVCSGADQRKHQRFASLTFVSHFHPHPTPKGPVTRTIFPLNDINMSMLFKFNMQNSSLCTRCGIAIRRISWNLTNGKSILIQETDWCRHAWSNYLG